MVVTERSEGEPPKSDFLRKLEARWSRGLFVSVGLDTDPRKTPGGLDVLRFNQRIIDATIDLACAFKPNAAFYERLGDDGPRVLRETVAYIKHRGSDVPVILDAKRADIESTNEGYVESAFDIIGADAITVHPYLGREALQPFLDRTDKGVIVLARTSNKGAGELQDLEVAQGEPLYLRVAKLAAQEWNENGNVGLVVGATYPEQLGEVRAVAPNLPILIPGIGAQGGDLEKSVKNGKDEDNAGIIVNASRNIIYASSGVNFESAAREATQRLTEDINRFRMAA